MNILKEFLPFALKVIIVHSVTYILCGVIFSNVFNYSQIFQMDIIKDYMLPYGSVAIWLGPLLQPLRGLLFAVALWPIRKSLLTDKKGWLSLWILIVIIGILSTPSASPSSIEGLFYSKIPLWYHLMGLPEVLIQTLLFSVVLLWWEKKNSDKKSEKRNKMITEVITSVSTACFAYIGYAVAAVSTIIMTNAQVDITSAGSDLKTQLMFIVAFIVNAVSVFFIGKKYSEGKLSLWNIFIIYFLIDTLVPWAYSIIILGSTPTLEFAVILGLLPALIITLSVKSLYKKIKKD